MMVIENTDVKFVIGVSQEGAFEGKIHCHVIDKSDGTGTLTWLTAEDAVTIARALLAAASDQERPSVDETAK